MTRLQYNYRDAAELTTSRWSVGRGADGAVLFGDFDVQTLAPRDLGAEQVVFVPRYASVRVRHPVDMHLGHSPCGGHIRVDGQPHRDGLRVAINLSQAAMARIHEARQASLSLDVDFELDVYADGSRVADIGATVESTIGREEWLRNVKAAGLANVFVVELALPVIAGERAAHVAAQFERAMNSLERHDYTAVLGECRKAQELLEEHSPLKHAKLVELHTEGNAKTWTLDQRLSVAAGAVRQLLNAGAHVADRDPTADEAGFAIAATAAVLRLHAPSLRRAALLDEPTPSGESGT